MTECDGKKYDVFFLLSLSKELNLIWFVRGDETTVLEYCRVRLAGRAEWDAQMLYSSTASDRWYVCEVTFVFAFGLSLEC
jgi:hypothetical protein